MDIALIIASTLACLLLLVTATTAILGLVALLSRPAPARHRDCGHDRLFAAPPTDDRCWLCRHDGWVGRLLAAPLHLVHVHS